jgi:hypothetical protein
MLGDHHRLLCAKAELACRFLLERGGGERRRRIAAHFLHRNVRDAVFRAFQPLYNMLRVGVVLDAHFADSFTVDGIQYGREGRFLPPASPSFSFWRQEGRLNRPILLFIERLDQAFAFHDEPHGHALHAPGGKAVADLAPEERREFVAHEPVEHAPRLLGVHEIDVERARMFERSRIAFFRDLVKRDALVGFFERARAVFFFRSPSSPSAFTRCQAIASPSRSSSVARMTRVRFLASAFRLATTRLGFFGDAVARRKIVRDVDADLAFRQIADVAVGRFDGKSLPTNLPMVFALVGDSTMMRSMYE